MIDLVNIRRELAKIPALTEAEAHALVRKIEQAQKAAESVVVVPCTPTRTIASSPIVQHLGPHSILTTAALIGWSA